MVLHYILCLLAGYGFGNISTAYIVGKINHIDIRDHGSGNAGATNALRVLGKKAGIITYVGDFFKAMVPMLVFRHLISGRLGLDYDASQLCCLYIGIGVMLGHNYPFWLRFKGGRGIAVTTGVMSTFDILLLPLFVVVFFGTMLITKYVSVGSLCVAALFPIYIAFRHPGDVHMLILGIVFAIFAFIRHIENIKRLANGTENKIGKKVSHDL